MSAAVYDVPEPSEASLADDADNHLRTQFLRRIAHDIASPTGVTMTVLDELSTSDKPRPELLAMARRSLRRLMRLSEQLALCAELEGGCLEPERTAADIREITKRAVEDAVAIDGRRDVTAETKLPDGGVLMPADGRLLVSVIREAVGNALKFACSKVLVTITVEGANAVIRIEDDGPGFPADALATLGRRFVRRSASRGLGLSLSMAVEIVGDHGGTVTVETSSLPPGRRGIAGAALVIALPLAG